MSDTYTKLFSSITESTIVSEPVATRWLWVTMLAMADAAGNVYGSVPGLARRANISLAETEAALATFYAPDPYSRTKENEGRRIADIDGGWRLLNHGKYAAIRSEAERADYKREWDRQHRPSGWQRQQSDNSPTVRQESDESPTKSDSPTPPALTLAPDKSTKKKRPPQAAAIDFAVPDWIRPDVWTAYLEVRKRKRAPPTAFAFGMVITELIKLRDRGDDPNEVLGQSIRAGYTDVYPLKTRGNGNGNTHRESLAERADRKCREGDERERFASR